jgi:hypothetical protein
LHPSGCKIPYRPDENAVRRRIHFTVKRSQMTQKDGSSSAADFYKKLRWHIKVIAASSSDSR